MKSKLRRVRVRREAECSCRLPLLLEGGVWCAVSQRQCAGMEMPEPAGSLLSQGSIYSLGSCALRAVVRTLGFVPLERGKLICLANTAHLFLQWLRVLFGYSLDKYWVFWGADTAPAFVTCCAKWLWKTIMEHEWLISEVLQALKMSLWYSETAGNFHLF